MNKDDFILQINTIANKYEVLIYEEFKPYVNFNKFDDMRTNIYLLTDNEFTNKFNIAKASAITDEKNGYIYFNESYFYEDRTLVHEFLHRISTKHIPFFYHKSGIKDRFNNHFSFNEIITEYLCFSITKEMSEISSYGKLNFMFDLFDNKIGLEKIKDIYFNHKSYYFLHKMGFNNYKFVDTALYALMFVGNNYNLNKDLIIKTFNEINF